MSDGLGALDGRLAAMMREVEAADAIYHPSTLWTNLGALNRHQLERGGLEHFKRSVNQNYFNWLPQSLGDNQVRRVLTHWIGRPSLRPFFARMTPGPIEGFAHDRPLADWDARFVYTIFVALLWDVARHEDRAGLLDELAEPLVGDPIRITYRGRLVSQDLANSVREANRVLAHLTAPAGGATPIVAELGAGYGRLGHPLLAHRRCRYWVFDIPPALLIAEWYLPRVLPELRVFRFRPFASYAEVRDELEACDVAFFTANQIAHLPDAGVDAFVNISSLHEMRPAQIDHYLAQMTRASRQAIYLKQWRSFTNTDDATTITRDTFRLPEPWRVVHDGTDSVQDLFFELVATRAAR